MTLMIVMMMTTTRTTMMMAMMLMMMLMITIMTAMTTMKILAQAKPTPYAERGPQIPLQEELDHLPHSECTVRAGYYRLAPQGATNTGHSHAVWWW